MPEFGRDNVVYWWNAHKPSLDSLSKFGGVRIRVVHEAGGDFQHAPVSRRSRKRDPVNLLPECLIALDAGRLFHEIAEGVASPLVVKQLAGQWSIDPPR